jgi:phosphatidylglycerol lysyltransferase
MKKWLKFILVPLGFLIFIGALTLLNNQLQAISYAQIKNALANIPNTKILIAMGLALLYYILLGGYDIVAYKYIEPNVPMKPRDIAFICFISNAIGNNTGYSMLFGGSLRYRLYSIHNISMLTVTKVLFFSSATIWLGLLAIGGVIFTVSPVPFGDIGSHNISSTTLGIIFLLILVSYIILSAVNPKTIPIINKKISPPRPNIVSWQILLAAADWIVASLTLWILMPQEVGYFVLLKAFLAAQLLGIISQVPGGMGVFEAAITLLLPQAASSPEIIGGLLVYRSIFYFFPLSVALIMLFSYESVHLIKRVDEKTQMIGKAFSSIIVQFLGVLTFFAGMIGVFIATTVSDPHYTKPFATWAFNIVHFLHAVFSASLMFLARGIILRISKARTFVCIILGFLIISSLVIGKYPLIVYFVLLLIVFLFSKQYFYRTRNLFNLPMSMWWYCAIFSGLVLFVWIGVFINKENFFAQAALNGLVDTLLNTDNVGRFLRAAVGMSLIFIIVVLDHLRPANLFKTKIAKQEILNIVQSSKYTYAYYALADDKKIFTNDQKTALIMYTTLSNIRMAFFDPIGEEKQKAELLWKFKEDADREQESIVFIGADKQYIRFYKDIGLDIFPLGKKAKTFLPSWKDEGDFYKHLQEFAASEKIEYEILTSDRRDEIKEHVYPIFNMLEANAHYDIPSPYPGHFDKKTFANNDYAVLKKNGVIYAFAVLEKTHDKNEMSAPVMGFNKFNHDDFAYLMYKNYLYAKSENFNWFDLGLTPFKSDDDKKNVMSHFAKLFIYSPYFNNDIDALKNFKEQFHPIWREKFMAMSPSISNVFLIRHFMTKLIRPKKHASKIEFFKRFFGR